MQPLGDRILVKPLEATERMSGGVIIPDVAQEKPQQGIVIAIGDGVSKREVTLDDGLPFSQKVQLSRIQPGDRVLYGKYAGSEITIEDVPYLVVSEKDCLGILPPLPEPEAECVGAEAVPARNFGRDTSNLEL